MNAISVLYRLVDGTQADPSDVVRDEKGMLRHKNGVPVALRDDGGPVTIGGRDVVDHGNAAAVEVGKKADDQPIADSKPTHNEVRNEDGQSAALPPRPVGEVVAGDTKSEML